MSACPSCGAPLPDDARFCPSCGTRLEAVGPGITERKSVTTLFADVVGFTALGERHDPEDVDAVLRAYFALARRIVERFGGVVEKFIGDAVVGLFGVPLAHEDDAERAVRAALELVAHLDGLPALGGERLQVRCAVNTGPVLVRLGARPEAGEGVLVGDAINTCARLLAEAPAMGVVVGELTRRLSFPAIAYDELPEIAAKGKAEAVRRWLAQHPIARRGVDLAHTYGAELVGREVELGILKGLLARVTARSAPQLALVIGEAGAGKTRLVFELARWIDQEPGLLVVWRQGRCLPYGESFGFQPLAEVVRAHAGITDGDDDGLVIAKVRRALGDAPDREWIADRLGALLGLPSRPAERTDNFAAWARFLDVIAADRPAVVFFDDVHWADQGLLDFLGYLLRDGCNAPLLLLGAARPELLDNHPELSPLVGAATARNAPISRVDLPSLAPPEARRLVEELSPGVPADLATVLVERSGGNPFYMEELVRLLRQEHSGPAAERLSFEALPASLQALLAARLDTLDADQKGALGDAAVVGQTFSLSLVAALGDRRPDSLRSLLEGLCAREFVRPAPDDAPTREERFAFRHTMMRDTAYSQLSRRTRAEKHAAAGRWLEQQAEGRTDDVADALAHHYSTALDLARQAHDDQLARDLLEPAVHSLRRAGDRAFRFDPVAAERRYGRALRLLPSGSPDELDLVVARAKALELLGRYREASHALAVAAAGFTARGRRSDALLAAAHSTGVNAYLSVVTTDLEETAQALLASEELSYEVLDALEDLANAADCASDHTLALALAERALVVLAGLGSPPTAGALVRRGYERCALGDAGGLVDLDAALEMAPAQSTGRELCAIYANSGEAMRLYRGMGAALDLHRRALTTALQMADDPYAVCFSRFSLFQSLATSGDWGEALTYVADLEHALEELADLRTLQRARATTGLLRALRGQADAGLDGAVWAERGSRDGGPSDVRALSLASLAVVKAALGDRAAAASLLEEYVAIPPSRRRDIEWQIIPEAARLAVSLRRPDLSWRCGEPLLAQRPYDATALDLLAAFRSEQSGDLAAAAARFKSAAEGWGRLGLAYERGQALLAEGRCLAGLGHDPAKAELGEAREIFARTGAEPALREAASLTGD